jgi:hypothetical protein
MEPAPAPVPDAPVVEVTNIEAPPAPDNDVLATASVAAAALSGAAAVEATHASDDAAAAQATADAAAVEAQAASAQAALGVTTADVERIADERVDKLVVALREAQAQPVEVAAPVKDQAPRSVKKVKRKTTFRDRYYGRTGDDE